MAFPTIATPSNAYHRPATFKAVYARPSGEKYQTLGDISEAELQFIPNESPNSSGKNRQCSYTFVAKCKMMQAYTTEMELVDSIINGTNSFLFEMQDSAAIPTTGAAVTEGWVLLSAAQVGVQASIDFSGNSDTYRFIQLEWKGTVIVGEYAAAVKASIDDDEFESSSDTGTFHTIGLYTAAKNGGKPNPVNKKPNGISSITLDEAGAGAPQTLGSVKNFKCVFSALSSSETTQRYQQYGYDIDIEYEWDQTDAANIIQLVDMIDTEIDCVIVTRDGRTITLSNVAGISNSYEAPNDYNQIKIVRFKHTGRIRTTSFDGIIS